jgi:hypothetical protein
VNFEENTEHTIILVEKMKLKVYLTPKQQQIDNDLNMKNTKPWYF